MIVPHDFKKLPFGKKKQLSSKYKISACNKNDDEHCQSAYTNFYFNLPLLGVMGMSTFQFGDTRIVMIGERHNQVDPNSANLGKGWLKDIVLNCSKYKSMDVFIEDFIEERHNIHNGRDIQANGDSLNELYVIMYGNQKCENVRFHLSDLRSNGIMNFIQYVLSKQSSDRELLFLLADVLKGEIVLAEKIYHKQIKNISKQYSEIIWPLMNEIMLKFKQDLDDALYQNKSFEDVMSEINFLADWGLMNTYLVLRMFRNDFSKHRLVYVGESHRIQIARFFLNLQQVVGKQQLESSIKFTMTSIESPTKISIKNVTDALFF